MATILLVVLLIILISYSIYQESQNSETQTKLESSTIQTRNITAKDIDINYIENGTGPPLILLHGLSDNSALWTLLFQTFSQHYQTIAPDVRGHGNSSKPDTPYSINLFSRDLKVFCDALNIQNCHIVGHSMGAAIAQQFAVDFPEQVHSLVLLSPINSADPTFAGNLTKLQKSITTGGMSAFFDEAIKLVVTPEFASANSEALLEAKEMCIKINSPTALLNAIDACLEFDASNVNTKIMQPTLIISGKLDAFTPVQVAEKTQQEIEDSELKIVEGVGHNLFIPEKIPELSEIVLDFLRGH
jgi:pimeloyl-ACP methyl ester carboxylesterase